MSGRPEHEKPEGTLFMLLLFAAVVLGLVVLGLLLSNRYFMFGD